MARPARLVSRKARLAGAFASLPVGLKAPCRVLTRHPFARFVREPGLQHGGGAGPAQIGPSSKLRLGPFPPTVRAAGLWATTPNASCGGSDFARRAST